MDDCRWIELQDRLTVVDFDLARVEGVICSSSEGPVLEGRREDGDAGEEKQDRASGDENPSSEAFLFPDFYHQGRTNCIR